MIIIQTSLLSTKFVEKPFQERFFIFAKIKDNASLISKNTEEKKRVIAHGILHLCGYKDKTEEEQKNACKRRFYLSLKQNKIFLNYSRFPLLLLI